MASDSVFTQVCAASMQRCYEEEAYRQQLADVCRASMARPTYADADDADLNAALRLSAECAAAETAHREELRLACALSESLMTPAHVPLARCPLMRAPAPTSTVTGVEHPISGAGNNCLLRSALAAMQNNTTTAEALREMLTALMITDGEQFAAWYENPAQVLVDLMTNQQLTEHIVRAISDMFGRTLVVLKQGIDDVYTCTVYGGQYGNWSGIAMLHRGDVGGIEGGHYTVFDTTRPGAATLRIRGNELPARG